MDDTSTEKTFPTTLQGTLAYKANVTAIDLLTKQLARARKVLPFVGAGLSAAYQLKTWKAFLEHYAEEWEIKDTIAELLKKSAYEAAADALWEAMDEHAFNQAVHSEYGKDKLKNFSQKGVFHFLPKLTTGPILTTNYDRIIEHTYQANGLDIERVVGAKITATQRVCEQDEALLIKIHGDCEDVTERILTSAEYDRHYGNVPVVGFDRDLPLPKALMKLMSGTPLLFLGCSLEADRTLNVLGHITRETNHGGHFALVAFPENPNHLMARRKHFSKHRITPIWYNPVDHHRLLTELLAHICQGLTASAAPTTDQPTPHIPPNNYRPDTEKSFFGREKELAQLRAWLASSKTVCNVHGAPGIGKSRLCHRFLELLKETDPALPRRDIDLTSANSASAFLGKLMDGLKLPESVVNPLLGALAKKDKPAIQASMQVVAGFVDQAGGILYFDNLEDPLEDPLTKEMIRPLAGLQRTRLLCSSRLDLDTRIAQNIHVSKLEDADAQALFAAHCHGMRKGAISSAPRWTTMPFASNW
jgi:SIR2-like domain/AAA ATPase domain